MKFERRDGILVAGTFLLVIGMAPFMPLIYAMGIGATMFFGIKWFVASRKKMIEKNIPEGICARCGEKISDKKCPNCDA